MRVENRKHESGHGSLKRDASLNVVVQKFNSVGNSKFECWVCSNPIVLKT